MARYGEHIDAVLLRLMGIFPTAWTASVWNRMPRARPNSAACSTGKITPVSLLAHMRLTMAVSGVRLLRYCSISSRPSLSTGSSVTRYPSLPIVHTEP